MNFTNLLTKHPLNNGVMAQFLSKSGNIKFSVIGGEHFYSTPRENVSREEFTEFEVALFDANTNNWASYNQAKPVFEIFNSKGEYQTIDFEDNPIDLNKSQNAVFGYIPKEAIEKAWEIL